MKVIELYANTAIKAIVHVPNLSQEEYEDRFDEILSELANKDVNIEDLTDSNLDTENEILYLYFLQKNELKMYSFDEKDDTPDMRIGEYLIFNSAIAEAFNKADVNGSQDFKTEDEIKIGGVSHFYLRDHHIRYRLDTYVVKEEPIEIALEGVEEKEDGRGVCIQEQLGEDGTTKASYASDLSDLQRKAETC